MNKKLSKPVAWKIHNDDHYFLEMREEEAEAHGRMGKKGDAVYSQEYVSALQHESAVNWEAAASLNVENQEMKKRIAELEAIKSVAEKLVRCKGRYHSEQNYRALAALFGVTTPDLPPVDGESETVIAELRAKLATPVRLMGEMLLHDWEHSVERQAAFQHRKTAWDARLEEDKKAIRAAGFTFTVEGDEQ